MCQVNKFVHALNEAENGVNDDPAPSVMAILPQRPLRGSRISSFYPVKSLPSLASLDSAFQLQEYISLLIRLDVHDVDSIVALPGKRAGKEKEVDEGAKSDAKDGEDGEENRKNDVTVDEACWIYEQLRRLAQDLTHPLITMLQQECTRASCPEMKAGEWLYLCVAHGTDGNVEQCCAIDYILHTLDSATALLNTPRAFPSRLQIPQSSHRHFSSLARRLGRIFAHAYFHHREAFEQAEAESSLYARFLALTSKFDLVPAEFLVIPIHSSSGSDSDSDRESDAPPPRLYAAAVEPRAPQAPAPAPAQGQGPWDRRGGVIPVEPRPTSNSPPGLNNPGGTESPRKMGRSRTDTMVLHDAYAVAEELAKASPKVPPFNDLDEPMSPVDAEDLPRTATLVVEAEEETGSSLPESPTLNSPNPPSAPSLPAEPQEDAKPVEEKPAVSVEPPVAPSEAAPARPEEAAPAHVTAPELEPEPTPVEADIVETVLASSEVEVPSTNPPVPELKDVAEEAVAESTQPKEEAKEAEITKEVPMEETKEDTAPPAEVAPVPEVAVDEEVAPVPEVAAKEEKVPVPEVTVKEETVPETSEVVAEASAPTPEPVAEIADPTPASASASASVVEELAPAPNPAAEEDAATTTVHAPEEVEVVAEIPDEAEIASVQEVLTESEAEATATAETEVEEKEVEAIVTPATEEKEETEKASEHVTEPAHAPAS